MVGPRMLPETLKKVKNEKFALQDLDYSENPNNVKYETQTQYELEYGEKQWKKRHTHCRTWNMARKLTNEENENLTWQELEYGEKH